MSRKLPHRMKKESIKNSGNKIKPKKKIKPKRKISSLVKITKDSCPLLKTCEILNKKGNSDETIEIMYEFVCGNSNYKDCERYKKRNNKTYLEEVRKRLENINHGPVEEMVSDTNWLIYK